MAYLEYSDSILRIVENYIKDQVYTSLPCKVLNVDNFSSEQVIDIQPQINRSYKNGSAIQFPVILDVPVIYPGGGGGLLSFPIAVGDTVLGCFSMLSIDEWKESRQSDTETITPSDRRFFELGDAIAIAGLYSKNTNLNPDPKTVQIKFAGSTVTLTDSGDVDVNAAKNVNVIASNGEIVLNSPNIKINGTNIAITGTNLTHNGKNIGDTHTHPIESGSSAPGPTGPPQ